MTNRLRQKAKYKTGVKQVVLVMFQERITFFNWIFGKLKPPDYLVIQIFELEEKYSVRDGGYLIRIISALS